MSRNDLAGGSGFSSRSSFSGFSDEGQALASRSKNLRNLRTLSNLRNFCISTNHFDVSLMDAACRGRSGAIPEPTVQSG